jgi:hypothetical protein
MAIGACKIAENVWEKGRLRRSGRAGRGGGLGFVLVRTAVDVREEGAGGSSREGIRKG